MLVGHLLVSCGRRSTCGVALRDYEWPALWLLGVGPDSTCIRAQRIIKIASAIVFFRGNAFRCPTTCQAQIA